jgi:hypothetical protein
MKLEGKDIVIVSNEPWSETWFSKHNYAYELSKNNRVYFVNPTERWSYKNFYSSGVLVENYSSSLFVVTYKNQLPALSLLLFRLNNFLVSRKLKRFFANAGLKDFIFWTFDPSRLYAPKTLGAKFSIFHSVDDYIFSMWGEDYLCANADLILCVSDLFAKTYENLHNAVYVIPHSISSEAFAITEAEAEKVQIPFKDYCLYVGNIDERLDYELLELALKSLPDTPFVFVGKTKFKESNLLAAKLFNGSGYPNLHHLGPKHFRTLKFYISGSKACIAFMNKTHHGNTIAHHKTLQYLALGKPVFSCIFSEYIPISELMYMDDDNQRLVDKLTQFIKTGEDPGLKTARIEHARKHMFDVNFERINQIIADK